MRPPCCFLKAKRAQIDCLYGRLSVRHPDAQNLSYLDPHLYLEKQDEGRAVPVSGRLTGHQLPVKTVEHPLAQNATNNLPQKPQQIAPKPLRASLNSVFPHFSIKLQSRFPFLPKKAAQFLQKTLSSLAKTQFFRQSAHTSNSEMEVLTHFY